MLKSVTCIVITTWNDEQETIKKFTNRVSARNFTNEQTHPLIIRKEMYSMSGGSVWGDRESVFTQIEETS